MNVANIFGPAAYAPGSLAFAWSKYGYTWKLPEDCPAAFATRYTMYDSEAKFLKKICDEIRENRPVVVRLVGEISNHFVVAYGYLNDGARTNDILVFDPAQHTDNTTTANGRDTTLASAISFSHKIGISGLRLVKGTRE